MTAFLALLKAMFGFSSAKAIVSDATAVAGQVLAPVINLTTVKSELSAAPDADPLHANLRKAEADTQAFLDEPWAETGRVAGFRGHSAQNYSTEIGKLIARHILGKKNEAVAWGALIHRADIDLLQCGVFDDERKQIAQKTLLRYQEKLAAVQAELARDPQRDIESPCYSVIQIFRSGYNDGHQQYLRSRGL